MDNHAVVPHRTPAVAARDLGVHAASHRQDSHSVQPRKSVLGVLEMVEGVREWGSEGVGQADHSSLEMQCNIGPPLSLRE